MRCKNKNKICDIDLGLNNQIPTINLVNLLPQSDIEFANSLKNFRARIDALANMQTCEVCNECYVGMHTSSANCVVICTRCSREKGRHHFAISNNMNKENNQMH